MKKAKKARSKLGLYLALGLVLLVGISRVPVEWTGVSLDYDSVLWVDGECYPDDWLRVIRFELRDSDGVVVDDQEVVSDCKVSCIVGEGECDSVGPNAWVALGGTYEVWFQGVWVKVDGTEYIAHDENIIDQEDERRFVKLYTVDIPYIIHFPSVMKYVPY